MPRHDPGRGDGVMRFDTVKHVAVSLNDGGHLTFDARKGPWTWREFICFVKADAVSDEDVTYIPVANVEEMELS